MSLSVLCHGCGQRVGIPEGYQRRKMQCPECGVMCEVAEAEERAPVATKAVSRKQPTGAPQVRKKSRAEAAPRPLPAPPADPTAPIRGDFLDHEADLGTGSDEVVALTCTSCGYRLRVPANKKAHYRQCHRCGSRVTEEADHRPLPGSADADDGQPYVVAGEPERRCPECQRLMPAETVICAGCGFNAETGEKPPPKTYTRIERHWHGGWPPRRRVVVWIVGQGIFFVLNGVLAGVMGESIGSIIISWIVFTLMLSFALGSYDCLDFTRNERGKVRLTQTWRVLFLPRPPTRLTLAGCDGVQTGQNYQVGILDWLIFISLVMSGVIPGLIWFFGFMQRDNYYVALTRDHGFAEHILYRGWNRDRAADIAHTIADATGLPYEGF